MSILGNRVLRKEDPRFLRGQGTYIENMELEGALTITFVRSLLAHARINGVDTSAAEALPNVQVLTGVDLDGVTTGPPPIPVLEQRMRRPVVAKDVVRFVGDIVAIVLSEDRATGEDAAELVAVDYDPLPVVVDMVEAARDEVLLFPEVGTNVAGRAGRMDHDQELFAECDVVVSDTIVSTRMAACPLEVRSAAAEVGPDGRTTGLALDPGAAPRSHGPRSDARAGGGRAPHRRPGRRRRLRSEERLRRRGDCSSFGSRATSGSPCAGPSRAARA